MLSLCLTVAEVLYIDSRELEYHIKSELISNSVAHRDDRLIVRELPTSICSVLIHKPHICTSCCVRSNEI